ncbi:hypothetical protein J437_LFUL006756 [Ladona fulva]|uniref:DDE Tnp4 domain-containing protein n=1 Tax=Ladona fulva TaxID=123851 RepID=A0A8K0NWQ4_LADFU|nr:hypothetical protein J437_LFUL006756 [Ladona fulva]
MEDTSLFVAYLLLEEEEELLTVLDPLKRMEPNPMYLARDKEGFQNILIPRHLLKDESVFRKFYRLNIDQFNYILFLATGESFASLSYAFRISPNYISRIVKQVLKLCSEKLQPIFMPIPTVQNLLAIAKDFEEKWNFPNCISAVDGKHIRIFCPGKSGSQFFNYKDFFSVVLLAFVDANYRFVMVDIGSYGREGDSGIIDKSNIGKLIKDEEFYPPPKLMDENIVLPHVIVGDDAFKLSKQLMKPYSRNDARLNNKKAVFNYRLSRARRVSENSFALLSQVFRIFYTPISVNPDVTDYIIMTACCLHIMLRSAFLEESNTCFFGVSNSDQLPMQNFIPLVAMGGFGNIEGFAVREGFTDYFNSSTGSVPWQMKQVTRTDTQE